MKYGSPSFSLYLVDGVDLLPSKVQTFTERRTAVMERVDGLGDSKEAMGPTGLVSLSIVQTGAFFDDRQAGMHAAFKTDGRSRTLMYTFTGGAEVISIAGVYRQTYEVIAQQGRLTRANVTYQVNGIPDTGGRLVQPLLTYTAAWDTKATPIDLGAAAPNGAIVNVQVTALTGFTSVATKVVHSADGATGWTDLVTVPAFTTAPTTARVVAGATLRYVAFVGVPVGTGSITLAATVAPNP